MPTAMADTGGSAPHPPAPDRGEVRWLLAGAGDIARSRVAAALSEARGSRLVAVFGRSPGNAERLAAQWGVPLVYHDYGRALAESGANAVYIATPHRVHVPMAAAALGSGLHFLCEKPLGVDAAECVGLLEASRRRPDIVASCSNYRLFTSQFAATARIVADGSLGCLIGGWAHDEEPYYNPSGAPLLMKDGMSPALGFGFYLVNMAQELFGLPEEVFAATGSFNCAGMEPFDIDDVENVLLRFRGGRTFAIYLNMATQGPLRHEYEFCFERGRVLWPGCPPHFNSRIRIATPGGMAEPEDSETPVPEGAAKPNWHLPMVQDFVDAVVSGRRPRCTLVSAVRTAQITEAILESARLGIPASPEYRGVPGEGQIGS